MKSSVFVLVFVMLCEWCSLSTAQESVLLGEVPTDEMVTDNCRSTNILLQSVSYATVYTGIFFGLGGKRLIDSADVWGFAPLYGYLLGSAISSFIGNATSDHVGSYWWGIAAPIPIFLVSGILASDAVESDRKNGWSYYALPLVLPGAV